MKRETTLTSSTAVIAVVLMIVFQNPGAATLASANESPSPSPTPYPSATEPWAIETRTPQPTPTSDWWLLNTTTTPSGIAISNNLNSEERRMLQDGINLLQSCGPAQYALVQANVQVITRGSDDSAIAYVRPGSPIVFLPKSGSINDPMRYKDSLRTFVAAVVLAHEARHIAMGSASTEPDAYAYTIPLHDACKPNDINYAENASPYVRLQGKCYPSYAPAAIYWRFVEYEKWRASLPYPGDPPPDVQPPMNCQ